MNYKNNAHRELKNMIETLPDYTLGEVLYSVLRITKAKTVADVKTLTDEEVFTAIEKSLELELE